MFKIREGKKESLQTLANEFFTKLNPCKSGTTLSKNALKKRVEKKLKGEKDAKKKRFYLELSKKNYKLLKEIIIGDPNQLTTIKNDFDRLIALDAIPAFYYFDRGINKSTEFGVQVLDLFNYTACRGSIKFKWLVDELGVIICPYCNYEHTFATGTSDDSVILHDFDHFIPKVIAPYLSLSFFNLCLLYT